MSDYQKTISWLQEALPIIPKHAVILGTGLNDMAEHYPIIKKIPYTDIPGFSASTAPSHKGNLITSKIGECPVIFMQGRFHFYEGYPMSKVIFPVRILALLGIKTLIVTNASGSLREHLSPGSIVNIIDHINLMGTNPLIGENEEIFGERFPSMNNLYSPAYSKQVLDIAISKDIPIHQGVYLAVSGPSLETRAECAMMAAMGADLVGMSTVPEVLAARHCGINVLAFSIVTNYSNLFHDAEHSQEEIRHNAAKAGTELRILIEEFLLRNSDGNGAK